MIPPSSFTRFCHSLYCETLVEDMARAPVQDALLYKQNLARLDAFLGEQLREGAGQERREHLCLEKELDALLAHLGLTVPGPVVIE